MNTDDETLDEFIARERDNLIAFKDAWIEGRARCWKSYPMHMPAGEWGEQLASWREANKSTRNTQPMNTEPPPPEDWPIEARISHRIMLYAMLRAPQAQASTSMNQYRIEEIVSEELASNKPN